MGAGNSKSNSVSYDKDCGEFMKNYMECVKKHPQGLSGDDECQKEIDDYKNCRKLIKDKNSSS